MALKPGIQRQGCGSRDCLELRHRKSVCTACHTRSLTQPPQCRQQLLPQSTLIAQLSAVICLTVGLYHGQAQMACGYHWLSIPQAFQAKPLKSDRCEQKHLSRATPIKPHNVCCLCAHAWRWQICAALSQALDFEIELFVCTCSSPSFP